MKWQSALIAVLVYVGLAGANPPSIQVVDLQVEVSPGNWVSAAPDMGTTDTWTLSTWASSCNFLVATTWTTSVVAPYWPPNPFNAVSPTFLGYLTAAGPTVYTCSNYDLTGRIYFSAGANGNGLVYLKEFNYNTTNYDATTNGGFTVK